MLFVIYLHCNWVVLQFQVQITRDDVAFVGFLSPLCSAVW